METKARFYNRIGILAAFALTGIVGAAVLYYGMFFVLALANYFDGFYKHDTFYQMYPTAASYLITFFSTGTLKHLPGYEIEFNLGIPLLFGCGMIAFGILLVVLLRKNRMTVAGQRLCGKSVLGKPFDVDLGAVRQIQPWPLWGLLVKLDGERYLYLFVKNRGEILEAVETAITVTP